MNINKAKKMAVELAIEHKLFGWKITFTEVKYVGGICWNYEQTLEYSKRMFRLNDASLCRKVILHEIAHALLPIECAHDLTWQKKCRDIGLELPPPDNMSLDFYDDFVDPDPITNSKDCTNEIRYLNLLECGLLRLIPKKSDILSIEREENNVQV